jgi:hypothetical protein
MIKYFSGEQELEKEGVRFPLCLHFPCKYRALSPHLYTPSARPIMMKGVEAIISFPDRPALPLR